MQSLWIAVGKKIARGIVGRRLEKAVFCRRHKNSLKKKQLSSFVVKTQEEGLTSRTPRRSLIKSVQDARNVNRSSKNQLPKLRVMYLLRSQLVTLKRSPRFRHVESYILERTT